MQLKREEKRRRNARVSKRTRKKKRVAFVVYVTVDYIYAVGQRASRRLCKCESGVFARRRLFGILFAKHTAPYMISFEKASMQTHLKPAAGGWFLIL